MRFLQQFDFNHTTGYWGVIVVSIAISSLFFSLAYMLEGVGWLLAYDAESNDLYLDVGWNWIRGSGVAFVVALVLFGISIRLLRKNRHLPKRRSPLFGKLDINQMKGLLGLVFLSVAVVFFFNGGLYRIEAEKWFYSASRPGQAWFPEEASDWVTSSYVMLLIGILMATAGWILIAMQWKAKQGGHTH